LVAAQVSSEASLLCFDEFQVTDVADALMMVNFFDELWRRGTVVVATSNRPPSALYLGGVNRPYFVPFIDMLENRCAVHAVENNNNEVGAKNDESGVAGGAVSATAEAVGVPVNPGRVASPTDSTGSSRDYRQLAATNQVPGAFTVVASATNDDEEIPHEGVRYLVNQLSLLQKEEEKAVSVPVMMGRRLNIPLGLPIDDTLETPSSSTSTSSSTMSGVCVWRFDELCGSDVGAADYKALCDHFHTLVLTNVPVLDLKDHNQARRFVTLIDELFVVNTSHHLLTHRTT
jgi:hypothetical protein